MFVDTICVKITATYNDGCLTDVNIEKVNLSEITPPENSETGKTFYWENTENMKPIKLN